MNKNSVLNKRAKPEVRGPDVAVLCLRRHTRPAVSGGVRYAACRLVSSSQSSYSGGVDIEILSDSKCRHSSKNHPDCLVSVVLRQSRHDEVRF